MRRYYAGAFLLALLLSIFFYDICFFGKTLSTSSLIPGVTPDGPYGFTGEKISGPFSFDLSGNAWVNEPNPYIISSVIREGDLPLWNTSEGLGMPLVANLNTEVLNPLKVFLNLHPSPVFQDIFFLLRLLVLGLFTYLFLREMGLSQIPSILGGSFFMLSGYAVWWINLHPLSTMMYLPAVFFFYERWHNRKDGKSAFFMALFFSFSILAGKLSELITGVSLLFLYGIFNGIFSSGFKGAVREGLKLASIVITGLLLSAPAFLPFYELHAIASPIAKAIRTGASSHTLPLLSSVSLWQPLFLGKNYFYSSWFNYEPRAMLMYAGLTILMLFFYAQLSPRYNGKILPFTFFSLLLFLQVYGLMPYHFVTHVPIFREVNYLKYNGMIYFSLSVISACALEHLISGEKRRLRFFLALGVTLSVLFIYYHFLAADATDELLPYLGKVFTISLAGLLVIATAYVFLKNKKIFGAVVLVCMLAEFFIYMPREHPLRYLPYHIPPGDKSIRQDRPYRIAGDSLAIPPLVSNAAGFSDVRGIDVLITRDYYIFFQNLISFSVPYTNSPDPLVAGSSPFSDLLGVKYIFSTYPLDFSLLEEKIYANVRSLRWVRLFDAMKEHNMENGAGFGFFKAGGEERFSFFFPLRFSFTMTERIKDPFLFAGFALKDASEDASCNIRVKINGTERNLLIRAGEKWADQWIDVSAYSGTTANIEIEGSGNGQGSLVLGDFGFSPGEEQERILALKLLSLRRKEINNLEYRGEIGKLYRYENTNVMDRAFVLHNAKFVEGFDEAVRQLQQGADFRKTALITNASPDMVKKITAFLSDSNDKRNNQYSNDKVQIKKYSADEIALEVESRGGLLVLSDLYYPGWKVKVNGKNEDVLNVFGVLRAVPIGSGKSEVIYICISERGRNSPVRLYPFREVRDILITPPNLPLS
jgi:hypothetical protein